MATLVKVGERYINLDKVQEIQDRDEDSIDLTFGTLLDPIRSTEVVDGLSFFDEEADALRVWLADHSINVLEYAEQQVRTQQRQEQPHD